MPSWVAQHILLGLEVLQGVAVQAEEALVPLLVQEPSKPGAWTLTVLAQVSTHHQPAALRQTLRVDLNNRNDVC